MTERSKETTQTIIPAEPAPDEQRPSTRKPSGKEPSSKEKHWEQKTLRPALEKSPEREQEFTTVSGYPIRRLYTPADLLGLGFADAIGAPTDAAAHLNGLVEMSDIDRLEHRWDRWRKPLPGNI